MSSSPASFVLSLQQHLGARVRALLQTSGAASINDRRPVRALAESRGKSTLPTAILQSAENYTIAVQERYGKTASRRWSRADLVTSPIFSGGIAELEALHARVEQVREDALAMRPYPRPFQIEIIEYWLELSGEYIFGSFWKTHYHSIRRRQNWKRVHIGYAHIRSGRQDGKSTGLAMCVVLGLLNFEKYEIQLYGPGHKQSRIILGMSTILFKEHPRSAEAGRLHTSCNKTLLYAGPSDVRKVNTHSKNLVVSATGCS